MAHALRLASASVDGAADAVTARLSSGALRLYDGTQPGTPDTAITTQTLLAECAFGTPAFDPAVDGLAVARAIAPEGSAPASGTPTWFRCVTAGGQPVLDGSVGASDADLVNGQGAISAGAEVTVESLTYRHPTGA